MRKFGSPDKAIYTYPFHQQQTINRTKSINPTVSIFFLQGSIFIVFPASHVKIIMGTFTARKRRPKVNVPHVLRVSDNVWGHATTVCLYRHTQHQEVGVRLAHAQCLL